MLGLSSDPAAVQPKSQIVMPARPLILVAEDSASDQLLLRRAIQKAGLDVDSEFVGDGIELVEYLERRDRGQAPSLLLLDLRMPRMDGFGVLKWLRAHPAVRPAHVVVLSSCCGDNELRQSRNLGVEHYVVKPGDPVEFAATLKRFEGYCTANGSAAGAEESPEAVGELLPAAH